MSHRMRAVHDGDDALPPRHRGQLADREELSGLVRDVAKMQHLRLRRDGGFESPQQVRLRRGAGEIQPRDFDLVPFFALIPRGDRKSTRLNSSHSQISYAVFCLKKKKL